MALRAGSDRLVPAEQYIAGFNAYMHSCCWEVTWNALGCPSIDQRFLANLISHLVLLGPFASRTPFDCETNDVDHELWTDPPTELRIGFGEEHEVRGILSSPSAREVLRWLQQNPAILLIEDLSEKSRFLAYCIRKTMPFSLANENTMNVGPQLARLIQNLKSGDKYRLPKTHNLWCAWSNIMSVLDAMINTPPPKRLSSNPALRLMPAVMKFCIPAEKCHRLTFLFANMEVIPNVPTHLSGVAWDGKSVGSGAYKYHVRVSSLKGIHIVRSLFGGVNAMRVKDGEKWSSWYGKPFYGTDDMEHEWDNPNKDLIFNFDMDIKKILGISIKSRVPGSPT